VGLSIFGDAGATGAALKNQLELNSQDYTALVQQFPNTTISRTLQFQPGTNFQPRTSAGLELVVQLPIVQAPFRIYWAYNFNRMSQVITAPVTQFPGPVSSLTTPCTQTTNDPNQCPWNIYKAQAPFADVWNSQVAPQILSQFNNPQRTNFFDPIRTFRFTVSRTF
jgi:outer membrane protein insertion porin family